MQKRQYTVADAILDTLAAHGVSTLFGYPGGAILPFYDALPYHKDIKHVLVRNEQGAAFAAQGMARSTKKLGVCLATSGPGATNLVTGIADAYLDSIPLLCITGQVPLNMIGKDMFQEVDMTGITINITKHNYLLEKPELTVETVTEAIAIALHGRPGPVHIDVPKDIMASPHTENFFIPKIELPHNPHARAFIPHEAKNIEQFTSLLESAQKPILIIGQGIKHAKAEAELLAFIEKTKIPVTSTLLAKGILPNTHPQSLGMLGMHGLYHANLAVHNADLIISFGSRFDDRIVGRYDSFSQNAKIIHVDIDSAELNKVVKTDLAIQSDLKHFLRSIENVHFELPSYAPWWKQIHTWEKEKPYVQETEQFTIRTVLASLQKEISQNPNNFIIVTDVGQHQMWSSLSLELKDSTQWLTSGGSGTMGFGLPTAIGAAFAHPDKTIIVIAGDGGIQMNIQEIALLKDHHLNIKVCIVNNHYLGMVRQWQELFYADNYSAVYISSPDYKKLAEAYGLEGVCVEQAKDMENIHKKVFSHTKPVVLEYRVEQEDNVFPMVPGGKTLGEVITQ